MRSVELERAIEVVTEERKAAEEKGKVKAGERANAHKCLWAECDRPATRRGLCDQHYYRYMRTYNSLDEVQREIFEDRCIAEGKVLPSRQGQRGENPYLELVG